MGNRAVHNENTNEKTPAAVIPLPVNYATLEADVAEYIGDLLESTRDQFGETKAEADMRIAAEKERFRRAPWAALLWYAEHMAPKEQLDLVNDPSAEPEAEGEPLDPQYSEMEIDGEQTVFATTDGIIEAARASESPQAQVLLHTYETALAGIKVASATPESQAMREQAVFIAIERLGMTLDFGDTRGALQ